MVISAGNGTGALKKCGDQRRGIAIGFFSLEEGGTCEGNGMRAVGAVFGSGR